MVGKLGILAHAGYFLQLSRRGSSEGQVWMRSGIPEYGKGRKSFANTDSFCL